MAGKVELVLCELIMRGKMERGASTREVLCQWRGLFELVAGVRSVSFVILLDNGASPWIHV